MEKWAVDILVFICNTSSLAPRHQLMGDNLSHNILIVAEVQLKVTNIVVVMLQRKPF